MFVQQRNFNPCIYYRMFVPVTKYPPQHILPTVRPNKEIPPLHILLNVPSSDEVPSLLNLPNVRPTDEMPTLAYFTECSFQCMTKCPPCLIYRMFVPLIKCPPLHILLEVSFNDEVLSLVNLLNVRPTDEMPTLAYFIECSFQ
jgi:hypothetical protein